MFQRVLPLLVLMDLLNINIDAFGNQCGEINIQEVANWANELPAFKEQDKRREQILQTYLAKVWPSDLTTRQTFYEFLSQPLQTVCSIPKKVGGTWLNGCGWFDGEKHVCMDSLKRAVDTNKCLVYSFGLGSDWDFEMIMADMGCTVRAFDPTIKIVPQDIDLNKIHFAPYGLGSETGESVVFAFENRIYYSTF